MSAMVAIGVLAAIILVDAAYALYAILQARREDRLCPCYWCSTRREREAMALYRGPGRWRAKLGHLAYRVRLSFTH